MSQPNRSLGQSQMSLGMPGQPVMRRTPPPRFRPCMIIIVVLALGLLFIGLTLTIIAHWPGYTGIGYNPLKIVGPVILSCGGLIFIGCIVEVVRKNQQEKKDFSRQVQERERMVQYAARAQHMANNSQHQQQYAPQQTTLPPQQRSILKSGSSYHGSQADSGMGLGTNGYPSAYNSSAYNTTEGTNMSYEQDQYGGGYPNGSANQMGYPNGSANQMQAYPNNHGYGNVPGNQDYGGNYEVHAMPDPSGLPPPPPELNDSGAEIPQPVRTRTRDHKKRSTASSQYANNGYNPAGDEGLNPNQIEADVHNGGYLPEGYQPGYDPNQGGYDPNQGREIQEYGQEGSFDMYDQNSPDNDREAKRRRRKERKRRKEAEAVQQMSAGGGVGSISGQQPLHVNIHAQPGVQVTITPTGTPSMARHNVSGETDI